VRLRAAWPVGPMTTGQATLAGLQVRRVLLVLQVLAGCCYATLGHDLKPHMYVCLDLTSESREVHSLSMHIEAVSRRLSALWPLSSLKVDETTTIQ